MIVMRAVVKFLPVFLLVFALLVLAVLFQTTSPSSSTPLIITSESSQWIENQTHGVRLEVDIPAGWQGRKTEGGIVFAERTTALSYNHQSEGIQAHVFVRLLTDFQLPLAESHNEAWSALKQIADDKHYTRDAFVSEPFGFKWGDHDAAYYLLNDGHQSVMIIMAMTLASERLVAFSVSSPWSEGQTIRSILPNLLNACRVNGIQLDSSALDHLPDPLVFPEAEPTLAS